MYREKYFSFLMKSLISRRGEASPGVMLWSGRSTPVMTTGFMACCKICSGLGENMYGECRN